MDVKSVVLAAIKNDVVAFRHSCQRKDVGNAGGMKPHPAVPTEKSNWLVVEMPPVERILRDTLMV